MPLRWLKLKIIIRRMGASVVIMNFTVILGEILLVLLWMLLLDSLVYYCLLRRYTSGVYMEG